MGYSSVISLAVVGTISLPFSMSMRIVIPANWLPLSLRFRGFSDFLSEALRDKGTGLGKVRSGLILPNAPVAPILAIFPAGRHGFYTSRFFCCLSCRLHTCVRHQSH